MATTVVLAGVGVGMAAPASAEAFGDGIAVTFGETLDARLPASVDLPAPSDGTAIVSVTFSWLRDLQPTWAVTTPGRYTVATPHCQPVQPCHVEAMVPTASIRNGLTSISVSASNGTAFLGSTSRQLEIDNPKPSSRITSPANYSTVWGPVTVTADAGPSSAGVRLAGVRFYVNPTGRASEPYVFDDTAPYEVTVPATDLAAPGASGTVWAVAEDVNGNLAAYDGSSTLTHRVTVVPPIELDLTTVAAPNEPIGALSNPVTIFYTAAIPASVPDSGGSRGDYIATVEIYIDGKLWMSNPWDQLSWYNSIGKHHRRVSIGWPWTPTGPGEHAVTLVARTGFGSVTAREERFLISDGAILSPVTSRGEPVDDGFVVTAGDHVPLDFRARTTVPGSVFSSWDIVDRAASLVLPRDCRSTDFRSCPSSVDVRGVWVAPRKPGTYVLRFVTRVYGEAHSQSMTRRIVVQPRGRLRISASRASRSHERFAARLTRTDTGASIAGVPTALWRRATATGSWHEVLRRTTDEHGRVSAVVPSRSGMYRWSTAGDPGTLSAATSPAVRIRNP